MTLICQISDLHIRRPGELSYGAVDCSALLERAVAAILRLPQRPDAVVATGDLTDGGSAEEYANLAWLLAALPMPVFLVPGNHDERSRLRAAFPEHAYLRQWEPFIQYAIDDWPLRLVALDTVIPGKPGGRLCDERLAWLERTLALQPKKPTLLFMHHPPFPTLIGHMDQMLLEDPGKLESIVRKNPQVERVLCGHIHRPIQARFGGTIAQICPSTAHQMALDLSDAPGHFTFEPPAFHLHALRPGAGVITHTGYANAFSGPFPFGGD